MQEYQWVIFPTDALLWLLLAISIGFVTYIRHHDHLLLPWRQVLRQKSALITGLISLAFISIGYLDSIHFQRDHSLSQMQSHLQSSQVNQEVVTLFDALLAPLGQQVEETYSAPFSLHSLQKKTLQRSDGTVVRYYPPLQFAGKDLSLSHRSMLQDVLLKSAQALLFTCGFMVLIIYVFTLRMKLKTKVSYQNALRALFISQHPQTFSWRTFFITLFLIVLVIVTSLHLAAAYHILGTDQVGRDVFYMSLKSIRTGLVIGTVTTLIMLPFALLLGILAGYFLGFIDDVIQYLYTTLSSVPGVLLISASVLAMQIFIENHPNYFSSLIERADVRLLTLCIILGITSWTSLCRMLRGETLKLREMDYISAAKGLGVSHFTILLRHITPNVFHIVIISIVLDFSGLVLAEAVLSYVGVGVDPLTFSWGNMINAARAELARDPIVWWPLFSAFIMMFTLVFSANIFADSVQQALDPRARRGA